MNKEEQLRLTAVFALTNRLGLSEETQNILNKNGIKSVMDLCVDDLETCLSHIKELTDEQANSIRVSMNILDIPPSNLPTFDFLELKSWDALREKFFDQLTDDEMRCGMNKRCDYLADVLANNKAEMAVA